MLPRVVSQTHSSSFAHFQSFLQVLETFGTGYNEDIDTRHYKLRDQESHRVSTINALKKIQKCYDLALIQIEDLVTYDISEASVDRYSKLNTKTLRDQLKILFQF
jgi:hypothetical protein